MYANKNANKMNQNYLSESSLICVINKRKERVGSIVLVLEHLPSKWEALGLIPNMKKKKKEEKFIYFTVLGLELRAFILSHSTSPIFVKGFLR
jgi:hypothetical protein